jgi:hypothetical protein
MFGASYATDASVLSHRFSKQNAVTLSTTMLSP